MFTLEEKISVIVPAYNAEKYLGNCLLSLLNQKYSNLEIIVADDGSSDATSEIAKNFMKKDPRIKLLVLQHTGVSNARNKALEMSSGEWIAFCDSDDIVPPNAYRTMLRTQQKEESDIIVGTLCIRSRTGQQFFRYHKRQNLFEKIYYGPSLCNRIFRKAFLGNMRFMPRQAGEDIIFLTEIFMKMPRVSHVHQIVYVYQHDEAGDAHVSLTHSYTLQTFYDYVYCWTFAKKRWKQLTPEYGDTYLAQITVPYLYRELQHIKTIEKKSEALEALKVFLQEINWEKHISSFHAIFGVPYSIFNQFTSMEYFDYALSRDGCSIVLEQFYAGHIGMRYILKCVCLWARQKMQKRNEFRGETPI